MCPGAGDGADPSASPAPGVREDSGNHGAYGLGSPLRLLTPEGPSEPEGSARPPASRSSRCVLIEQRGEVLLPSSHCMATTRNMHGDLIAGRMLVRWAAVPHGPCRSDPHRSDHPSSDRGRIRTAMAEGARRRAAHVGICAVSLQPVRQRADARSRRSIRRQWDSRGNLTPRPPRTCRLFYWLRLATDSRTPCRQSHKPS